MPRTTVVAGQVATAALGNNFMQLTYDQPRNYLLNGHMEVWQRGTTALPGATSGTVGYTADRWQAYRTGFAAGLTGSRVTGPTGARYALRIQRDADNTSTSAIQVYQTLETAQAINLAGQQVTFSAWIRKGANFTGSITMRILYGTGTDGRITGTFTGQTTLVSQTKTLSTSWVQASVTGTLPSTASEIAVGFQYVNTASTAGINDYFEYSLAQLEIGATPSPFHMNGGNISAEYAGCQRFYQRIGLANGNPLAIGTGSGTTTTNFVVPIVTTMRIAPSSVAFSNIQMTDGTGTTTAITGLSVWNSSPDRVGLAATHALNDSAHRPYFLSCSNSAGYIELIAEL
jgi:hypothetical protein